GGCSQPRLAPHVRLQVSKWVETPGRSNAIWETGRLSRPPDRSRILEGLTLTIATALARLHRACNPAPRRCAANAPAPIRRSNHLAHRPHQSVMRSSALATLSILAASAAP